MNKHEIYMKQAINEAIKALDNDEVPIGCVIVHNDNIIAKAHNQVETLKDPTAHAEMIALTQACATLESKWLQQAIVYVTIEPCLMCTGALTLARIKKLIFGAADPKTGACDSVYCIPKDNKLNHKFDIEYGVLENDCSFLISEFFKKKRTR